MFIKYAYWLLTGHEACVDYTLPTWETEKEHRIFHLGSVDSGEIFSAGKENK